MKRVYEDFVLSIAVIVVVPIVALLLLVIGMILYFGSPFIVIGCFIFLMLCIKVNNKTKPTLVVGNLRPITIPRPVKKAFVLIVKVILTILILGIFLLIMAHLPIWLAATILCCMIGYSVGRRLQ